MSRAIFPPSKLIEKRRFVFAIEQKSRELLEEWENPTIGILLCADKNDAVVRYTLPEDEKQIFASNYKLFLTTESEIVAEINSEQEKFKLLASE